MGFNKYTPGLVAGEVNGDGWTDLFTLVVDQRTTAPQPTRSSAARAAPSPSCRRHLLPEVGFPGVAHSVSLSSPAAPPSISSDGLSSTGLGLLTGDGAGGFTASASRSGRSPAASGTAWTSAISTRTAEATSPSPTSTRSAGRRITRARSVDVLLGDGSGGFALSAQYAVPEVFQIASTPDVDGDAHLDVASTAGRSARS